MDDHLDGFYLRGSTQWDALNHVRYREHGYWGGRTQDPTDGPNGLGIDHWAEHGIAGRGLLIDVAGWFEAQGRDLDPLEPDAITVEDMAATLAAQGVEPGVGGIWCLRTGWVAAYRQLDGPARTAYAPPPAFAGLHAGEDMARWIWIAHPAALCCDNPVVEGWPRATRRSGPCTCGSCPRWGWPWVRCSISSGPPAPAARWATGRSFHRPPLKLPSGVDSPRNALAIL